MAGTSGAEYDNFGLDIEPTRDSGFARRQTPHRDRSGCLSGCGSYAALLIGGAMLVSIGGVSGALIYDKLWGQKEPDVKAAVIRSEQMHPTHLEIFQAQNITVEINAQQQRVTGIFRNIPGSSLFDSSTRIIISGKCLAGMDLEDDAPKYDANIKEEQVTAEIPTSKMVGCVDTNVTFMQGTGVLPVTDDDLRNRALSEGSRLLPLEAIRQGMPDAATREAVRIEEEKLAGLGYKKIKVNTRPAKEKTQSPRSIPSPTTIR